jgi:hypothetical protein
VSDVPESIDRLHVNDVGAIVTTAAAATFVLSVAYEFMFASALGLSLANIPITLTDFTKNALSWLPILAAGVGIRLVLNLIGHRLRPQPKPREPLPKATGCAGAFLWFFDNGWIFLHVGLWLYFFLEVGEPGVAIAAMFLAVAWTWIANWILRHPDVGGRMTERKRVLAFYGPALAMVALGLGWGSGVLSLTTTKHSSAMIQVGESARTVRVLRLYENGLLALDETDITFVRWDSVHRLTHPSRDNVWRGFTCRNFRCTLNHSPPAGRNAGDESLRHGPSQTA